MTVVWWVSFPVPVWRGREERALRALSVVGRCQNRNSNSKASYLIIWARKNHDCLAVRNVVSLSTYYSGMLNHKAVTAFGQCWPSPCDIFMAKTGTGNKGMWVCENMAYQINDHNCCFFRTSWFLNVFAMLWWCFFWGSWGSQACNLCRFQFLAVVCLIARQPRIGHSGQGQLVIFGMTLYLLSILDW
jgi:hypothetical protein